MGDESVDYVVYKPVKVPEITKCKYIFAQSVKSFDNRVPVPVLGTRHCQVALLFWMVFTALGFNVILSVTIVAMTDQDGTRNHSDIPVSLT